jgi:hypothetical protein
MRHNLMLMVFAAVVLTAGASLAASPAVRQEASKEKGGDSERAVKMKDMPAAVQQTVREQSRGAKIRGLSVETENGVTNYEVELRVNGHARDVLIDPSGAVVSVEEQVALASLPSGSEGRHRAKRGPRPRRPRRVNQQRRRGRGVRGARQTRTQDRRDKGRPRRAVDSVMTGVKLKGEGREGRARGCFKLSRSSRRVWL